MLKNILVLFSLLLVGCSPIDNKESSIKIIQDEPQLLSAIQKRRLTNKILELNKNKDVQLVIKIVSSIPNNGTIESYANEYFNKVGIGKEGRDRGLLILISMKSKKIRIEVGRGNEGWLPDHKAHEYTKLAIDNFKESRYYEGLEKIVNAIENGAGE